MPSAEHMIHGMFLAYMHVSDYFHVLQLLQILLLTNTSTTDTTLSGLCFLCASK